MTDYTYWSYEEAEGFPPDGEGGLWIGYNDKRFPFIMWWHTESECWVGVGLDPENDRQLPLAFQAKGDMADYIKHHARLPEPYPWMDSTSK